MMGWVFRVAVIALTAAGCVSNGQTSSDAGTGGGNGVPCDPLAPHELPVTLATVLGVGRDAQGTTYVADEVSEPFSDRVFVSSGDTLWRKRVNGSGQTGGGADADYNLAYEDGAISQALLVQIRGGATTAMALAPAGSRAFVGDPSVTENLTVLVASVVDSMTLRNLPGEVTIEYVADVADGHILVVTRPTDDWSYEDFRLFYGTADMLVERTVVHVTRAKGGDTTVDFTLVSELARATFTVIETFDDAGYSVTPGPGTLVIGAGPTRTLTERPGDSASLDGYQFTCRSN